MTKTRAKSSDTAKTTDPAATPRASVAQLIERYRPPADTFDVILQGGERLTFRARLHADEWEELRDGATAFAHSLRSGTTPETWKPYQGLGGETVAKAYIVAQLSADPKISQLDALRLAQEAMPVLDAVYQAMEGELTVRAVVLHPEG